jgi:cytoskeleton protein RodZ
MASQVQPVPERLTAWLLKEPAGTPAAGESAVGQAEPLPTEGAAVGPAAGPAAAATDARHPLTAAAGDGASSTAPPQAGPSAPSVAADPRGTPTQAAAGAFPPDRLGTTDPAQNTRIVLKARTDCWIEIKDIDSGKLVYARLLRAGDTYAVADRPGLRLLAGNAGGLDIMVDGKTLPPLGRPGAVARNIALDPVGLSEGLPDQGREG